MIPGGVPPRPGLAGGEEERDYAALLGRLHAARRFGMRLELDRVEGCLAALGRPQERLGLLVQVAGTNGKGSTAAFVESILRAAGVRAGLFSSPHLSRLTERFRVGGEELAPGELLEADRAVEAAAVSVGVELTFFERITAMAALAFAARGVDAAVFEVGMGGRMDATTALGAQVAAVTGVALDHQEHLGPTLADIAREKAGIFRAGQLAVVGASGEPEAVPMLVAAARARGVASLTVVDAAAAAAVQGPLGLPGEHQRANAACALAIASAAERVLGRTLGPEARARGLASCRVAGRLERVAEAPAVVLDGAHNPQGARALAREIPRLVPGAARVVLVLGVSADKDAGAIAAPLCEVVDEVVATAAPHERAASPGAVALAVRETAPQMRVAAVADVPAALELARERAGAGGLVIAAGSLFLVGAAREALLGERADPLPVSDPVTVPGAPR